MTARVLGVDIGTTAVKAIALDEHGRVAATARVSHDGLAPRPGWSEGDPDAWWRGAWARCGVWPRTRASMPSP